MTVHKFRPPRRPKEKFLNVEHPAPFVLVSILVLAHLIFALLPIEQKNFMFLALALIAEDGDAFYVIGRPLGNFAPLITHTLLHGDWSHVLMNSGMILAFGVITARGAKNAARPVLRRFSRPALVFLGIFFAGAIVGGLGQWLLWFALGSSGIAIGASGGGAALFASAGWAMGGRDRMLAFGIITLAFNAIAVAMGAPLAWAAHVGGFAAGALLAPLWIRPSSVRGMMG